MFSQCKVSIFFTHSIYIQSPPPPPPLSCQHPQLQTNATHLPINNPTPHHTKNHHLIPSLSLTWLIKLQSKLACNGATAVHRSTSGVSPPPPLRRHAAATEAARSASEQHTEVKSGFKIPKWISRILVFWTPNTILFWSKFLNFFSFFVNFVIFCLKFQKFRTEISVYRWPPSLHAV